MGKLAATSDGFASQLLHERLEDDLVLWVARAKIAGNGKSLHVGSVLQDSLSCSLKIEGLLFLSRCGVPPRDKGIARGPQLLIEVRAVLQMVGVADEQRANGGAVALNDGVGRQSRR